jgi:hypothetical protein
MLVHDKFVFLQVRKTGCTFIADALRQELPAESLRTVGKHLSWTKIPAEAEGQPVLAYVRNPWDWYVSWYHFNKLGNMGNPIFRALSDGGELDFAATVSKACTWGVAETGSDLYTFLLRTVVGRRLDSELLTIGRFESLVEDLESFLLEVGVPLADGGIERIRATAPVNASDRGPYGAYYDDELRDLVGGACRPLIERFGYEF